MAKQYQPRVPFNVAAKHFPCTLQKVNGANDETYPDDGTLFYCSAVAWVGVQKVINDVATEEDTLTVETWYNPAIKKGDKIRLLDDMSEWRVIVTPENINRRGQYMRFKVVRLGG